MASSLSNVDFMDLYVHVNGSKPTRMRPFVKDKKLPPQVEVPEKFNLWIDSLKSEIGSIDKTDFSLAFDGIRYRVSKSPTASGEIWASLRKIPTELPLMSNLRIPSHVQNRLKYYAKNSGLIIICGATGEGKSTTANALIGNYLSTHGDVCVTIEDPVEYDLQGQNWGTGASCFQFEAYEDEHWAEYLKMSLRWHPRYIFLGELRTPESTAQALRAATSGHLVITTLHAGTIQDALHSIRQLALPVAGERADNLIADAFLSCVNQKLSPFGPKMKILYAEGRGLGDPVKSLLRSGKIEQLETYIEKQNPTIKH
jgi:Tfp pilus assembly pilus retraction ATPase PilT